MPYWNWARISVCVCMHTCSRFKHTLFPCFPFPCPCSTPRILDSGPNPIQLSSADAPLLNWTCAAPWSEGAVTDGPPGKGTLVLLPDGCIDIGELDRIGPCMFLGEVTCPPLNDQDRWCFTSKKKVSSFAHELSIVKGLLEFKIVNLPEY